MPVVPVNKEYMYGPSVDMDLQKQLQDLLEQECFQFTLEL